MVLMLGFLLLERCLETELVITMAILLEKKSVDPMLETMMVKLSVFVTVL
jgi:hypothetical protein